MDELTQFERVVIDLPGHGRSQFTKCNDLDDCCKLLNSTLSLLFPPQQPLILIGYSMGGRIAMHGLAGECFSDLNIVGAIVEGETSGFKQSQRYSQDCTTTKNGHCASRVNLLNVF
ncbi:alpha/beta fold hydrolase [Vibrio parahaemolyticus]|nr:alpha/beta fold hydrolase [Vibrio parahaemolyticus]